MRDMTWEQKLQAFQSICEHELRMRRPGDWYVSGCIEIQESADSSVLVGSYGNGATPQAAVEDHWRVLVTDLPAGGFLVVNAHQDTQKQYRWNGFMWSEVPR